MGRKWTILNRYTSVKTDFSKRVLEDSTSGENNEVILSSQTEAPVEFFPGGGGGGQAAYPLSTGSNTTLLLQPGFR